MPVEGFFTGSPPEVTAQTWILYDATYEQVLAEQDADQRTTMASTTKMMTALVAFRERLPVRAGDDQRGSPGDRRSRDRSRGRRGVDRRAAALRHGASSPPTTLLWQWPSTSAGPLKGSSNS